MNHDEIDKGNNGTVEEIDHKAFNNDKTTTNSIAVSMRFTPEQCFACTLHVPSSQNMQVDGLTTQFCSQV